MLFHSTLVTRTRHIVNIYLQFLSFVPTRNLLHFMSISVLWSRHKTLLGCKWLGTFQIRGRLVWNVNILSSLMLKQVIATVTAVFTALMEIFYVLFQVSCCLPAVSNSYCNFHVVSNVIEANILLVVTISPPSWYL
jgi:hypothetical protein